MALKEGNSGFAREIAAFLPAERAAPLLQWASLLEDPQRQIDALIAAPSTPVEDEALLAGWTRFARGNRDLAMRRFDAFVRARGLTEATASPLRARARAGAVVGPQSGSAALFQARRARRPRRLRAGVAGARRDVERRLASGSPTRSPRCPTRNAVSRAGATGLRAPPSATATPKLARQLYESVLTDDNFYSIAAAARLGQPLAPHPERLVIDEVQLKQIEQLPALVRARELFLSDLRDLANQEWAYGYEMLPQTARPQAVQLAVALGLV